MPTQKCPGCSTWNDVSIFVTGQRVRCAVCTLPFTVQRQDSIKPDQVSVHVARRRIAQPPVEKLPASQRRVIRPHPAVDQQQAKEREQARKRRLKPKGQGIPVQASPAQTQPNIAPVVIPGFELYEIIGKGGMGRVYRARQQSLGRVVAIKVLSEDLAKHKSFIRRFEKETASLAALNHPNISSIIDRGHVGLVYYFVMEFIDGPSLRHRINQQKPSLKEALELALTLSQAVFHAHQRGVIHRDLKPENILFTSSRVLKVVDFGLANILDEQRRWSMTRTKVSMGTVNYMAPEQRRDAKNVDHRADIYSVGVMLYELLAGELPLGRFEPPSHFRSDLPKQIDDLVLRMLNFDCNQRPQNLRVVEAVLSKVLAQISSAAVTNASEQSKPAGQKKSVVADPPSKESTLGPIPFQQGQADRFSRKWRLPISRFAFWTASSLGVLVLVAVLIFVLLMRRGLIEANADLVLKQEDNSVQVRLVHSARVWHINPKLAGPDDRLGTRRVIFDFRPSMVEAQDVHVLGGNWIWMRSGLLDQDSCRNDLTINQQPAFALFGATMPPQRLHLQTSVSLAASEFTLADRKESANAFLRESLGAFYYLARLDTPERVGLGFLDRAGQGLQVLLGLSGSDTGHVVRVGKDMELISQKEFKLDPNWVKPASKHNLELVMDAGLIRLQIDGQVMTETQMHFSDGFTGSPAVLCQNAHCSFHTVEYTYPSLAHH